MAKEFKGTIDLGIRDSTPDWEPYLADKALRFIRDSEQVQPDKPWFMFYCPGADHAPHHTPKEWVEKYRGVFDDGDEAYREWVLPRMIERGILPADTDMTEINPMPDGTFTEGDRMRPWDSLSSDEKKLFSRMAEIYAAYSEYTDHELGRVIDYLEESGQLDNTIIVYAADNGASGEGSPSGSTNENKFFNSWPDDVEENLAAIDGLGGPDSYNHYPVGWAVAFSTPFQMFKRYPYQGGIALVISWPAGIAARGEVRNQYHHVTDIVPTLLEAVGVEFPDTVNGYAQTPLPGMSMAYTFEADGPTRKWVQHYEMLGTRGIWADGWKAVAVHGPNLGTGHFKQDAWQLFVKERTGDHFESHWSARLYVGEEKVAEQEIRTQTGHFTLCGEGLCIGYDGGDNVTNTFSGKFSFSGGQIHSVTFDVADDAYIDLEQHYAAAMSRD